MVKLLMTGTAPPLIGAQIHYGLDSTDGLASIFNSTFVNSPPSNFLGTTSSYLDKGLLYLGIMGILLVVWLLLHEKT